MRRRRDMAIPNSGNPFWQIDFKSGQFRGLIRNVFEPARYEKWFDGGKFAAMFQIRESMITFLHLRIDRSIQSRDAQFVTTLRIFLSH